jgi:hypothetical protein
MLDFDAALAQGAQPPLLHDDGSFEEIRADKAFVGLAEGWAEWLLELRRLLTDDGSLVVGLAGRQEFERLSGRDWDEASIGMTVLSALDGPRRRAVFHSDWWLRAHFGRAFEILSLEEAEAGRVATLRRKPGEVTAEDLERFEPGDQRELAAAQANATYLAAQLDGAALRWEEQREDLDRELMRRSFANADAEWARGGPGSPGSLIAAEYEATTSWRMTKPLRAVGRLLRRDR